MVIPLSSSDMDDLRVGIKLWCELTCQEFITINFDFFKPLVLSIAHSIFDLRNHHSSFVDAMFVTQ